MLALALLTPWVLFAGWWVAWRRESRAEAVEWMATVEALRRAKVQREIDAANAESWAQVDRLMAAGVEVSVLPLGPRPLVLPRPGPPEMVPR